MKRLQLEGSRFGMLVVVARAAPAIYENTTHSQWLCKCDCGNQTIVQTQRLRTSKTKSCGCYRGDAWEPGRKIHNLTLLENTMDRKWKAMCVCGNIIEAHATNLLNRQDCGCRLGAPHPSFKHGETQSREYRSWAGAKGRCLNPSNPKYPVYGGRGIKFCDRWANSFAAFLEDMGRAPPHTEIDRINVNGNYEPANCRWATRQVQSRNKQNSISWNGQPLKEIASNRGINYYTLRAAFRRGENPETFEPKRAGTGEGG